MRLVDEAEVMHDPSRKELRGTGKKFGSESRNMHGKGWKSQLLFVVQQEQGGRNVRSGSFQSGRSTTSRLAITKFRSFLS